MAESTKTTNYGFVKWGDNPVDPADVDNNFDLVDEELNSLSTSLTQMESDLSNKVSEDVFDEDVGMLREKILELQTLLESPLPLVSGFIDNYTSGATYRKKSNGEVVVKGTIVYAGSIFATSTPTHIVTLPVGFRPLVTERRPCSFGGTGVTAIGEVLIYSDGKIHVTTRIANATTVSFEASYVITE